MIQFLFSSFAMLFDISFWEYGILAFVLFCLFSFLIRFVVRRRNNLHISKLFYVFYPLIALITIIPAVTFFQFFDVIKGLVQNGERFALMGLGLNILTYFYLNIFIGLFWTILNKLISKDKGET